MVGSEEREDQDGGGEGEGATDLAASFLKMCCAGFGWEGRHGCLLGGSVDEVVDAEFEVGAVELTRQRGELAYAGDGAPGGAVEGVVVGGAVEEHTADAAVGKDDEADLGDALLVEGRAGFFGNEREPGVVDLADDFFEVGIEVDAHGVGEDIDACVEALMGDGQACAEVASLSAVAGGLLCCLTDGVTGGGRGVTEVGAGGRGVRCVDQGLLRLLNGMLGQGCGRLLLRGGLGSGLLGLGRGWGWCGVGCSGTAHGLELLKGLLVEGRPGGLLGVVLVRDDVGRLVGQLLRNFLGHVEIGHLALFEDVCGIDESGLMEDDLGTVEDEPGDGHADDDGDVDGLSKARTGDFVVDAVEEMNQLVFVEFAKPAGAHLYGRGRGRGVLRGFERWHRLRATSLRRCGSIEVALVRQQRCFGVVEPYYFLTFSRAFDSAKVNGWNDAADSILRCLGGWRAHPVNYRCDAEISGRDACGGADDQRSVF